MKQLPRDKWLIDGLDIGLELSRFPRRVTLERTELEAAILRMPAYPQSAGHFCFRRPCSLGGYKALEQAKRRHTAPERLTNATARTIKKVQ